MSEYRCWPPSDCRKCECVDACKYGQEIIKRGLVDKAKTGRAKKMPDHSVTVADECQSSETEENTAEAEEREDTDRVHIAPGTAEKLNALALIFGIDKAAFVNDAIEEYLEKTINKLKEKIK